MLLKRGEYMSNRLLIFVIMCAIACITKSSEKIVHGLTGIPIHELEKMLARQIAKTTHGAIRVKAAGRERQRLSGLFDTGHK